MTQQEIETLDPSNSKAERDAFNCDLSIVFNVMARLASPIAPPTEQKP